MVLSIIPISSLTAIKADAVVITGDYGVTVDVNPSKYCQHCGYAAMPIEKLKVTNVTLDGKVLTVTIEYYFKHSSCSKYRNEETKQYKWFDCNKAITNWSPYGGDIFKISRPAGHSADWTFSDNKHTGTCKLCEKTVTENCSGGTATCVDKATCSICNNKYGSVNPDNHNYGEWSQIDVNGIKKHTRTCSLNNSHTETKNCSGGYTSCLSGAKCDTCNNEYIPSSGHSIVDGSCEKCGFNEESSTYEISTATQLILFARNVNSGDKTANAILMADIDLAGYDWKTICETGLYYNGYGDDSGYTGTFDGNGHVIRNIKVKSSTTMDASCGLFGTVSGTVKNLGVDGFTFVDGGKDIRTGAIVGQLITTNGRISNCYTLNATITPGEHVTGGIAGCVYDGTIENCYVAKSTINGTGDRYGYVVGDSRADNSETDRPATVINCYSDATPAYSGRVGNITNCEVKSADAFANGEVAYLLNGSVSGGTVYGQRIGSDEFPVLGGETVYFSYADCDATEMTYTNFDRTIMGHSGGVANCQIGKICDFCGEEYGEPDNNNHVCGYHYAEYGSADHHYKAWNCSNEYFGDRELHFFECKEENGKFIAKCTDCEQSKEMQIFLDEPSMTYDGTQKTPRVYVSDGFGYLGEEADYYVKYPYSVNAGTYEAIIRFANRHSGITAVSYVINPAPVSSCNFSLESDSLTYNGKVQTPALTVKGSDGATLTEGTDYTVAYSSDSKNVGTYTATVTMIGNYTGTETLSYEIVPMSIDDCTVTLSRTEYTYNCKERKPTVSVRDASGTLLTNGKHYSATYSSGRIAAGTYEVTVNMLDENYTGTKTVTYKINPISIDTCTISLAKTSYTYNAKVQTPTVTVKNAGGSILKKDTHYTVSYSSGSKNAGTYTATVTLKGNYTGTKTLSYKINPIDISKCTLSLSATSYTYNGKAKTPTVTVKNAGGATLTKGTHFSVKYPTGRVNVGTYKVAVTMKGNYTGTKNLSFVINPPKTTLNMLTGGSKAISVKVNNVKSISGYEVTYSTAKDFSSRKTVTASVTKAELEKATKTVKLYNLTTGKTYYVKVRTYKTVDGVNYYSGWSTYMTCKAK